MLVMPGLAPGIHAFVLAGAKTWMAGRSPVMTATGPLYFVPSYDEISIRLPSGSRQ
jgi:hypothetical protein